MTSAMTCPECGAKITFENWSVAMIGTDDWKLEVHTFHCKLCGWVTVQDWKWLEDDEEAAP